MKKYTILRNRNEHRSECEEDVILVKTADIYDVTYLNTALDEAYIWDRERDVLEPCEGFFPTDYFEDNENEMLVKIQEVIEDPEEAEPGDLVVNDNGRGEMAIVYDVSTMYMCAEAKAVDVQHGVNEDLIIFDYEDDEDGLWIEDEVDADVVVEHHQEYPDQPLTRLYYCDNGMVIRETSPFNEDEDREVYEIVDGANVDWK